MRKGAATSDCFRMRRPAKKSGGKPPRSKLRAFVPGGEVVFLLRCELVKAVAHGVELEAGDFLVQVLRDDVNLGLEVFVVRTQIFGGKRLVCEAHVHYGSGVTFGGGKIDKAAFGEEIDL